MAAANVGAGIRAVLKRVPSQTSARPDCAACDRLQPTRRPFHAHTYIRGFPVHTPARSFEPTRNSLKAH